MSTTHKNRKPSHYRIREPNDEEIIQFIQIVILSSVVVLWFQRDRDRSLGVFLCCSSSSSVQETFGSGPMINSTILIGFASHAIHRQCNELHGVVLVGTARPTTEYMHEPWPIIVFIQRRRCLIKAPPQQIVGIKLSPYRLVAVEVTNIQPPPTGTLILGNKLCLSSRS